MLIRLLLQNNMEKIICKNCGWENPTDIRYCEKCHNIINDKRVLSITEAIYHKSGYGWNWCAFIFGGIWGLFHKLYWPFVIQIAPIIIFSVFSLSGDNIDPIMEEQVQPSALNVAIGSTLCFLLILSPIINVFLGCRGNAWLHEKYLFKQYDKQMLLNKKINWLALCSGGISFLLIRSKKWLGIGTLISPLLYFLAAFIMVVPGNDYIRNTIGCLLVLFSMIFPIINGLIGAFRLNKTIATEEISDYNISKKYNWCRAVGSGWIIIIFWSMIYMILYAFG